jgi:uncharacterized protein (DUF433 family)
MTPGRDSTKTIAMATTTLCGYTGARSLMKTDRIEIDPRVMMGKPVIKGTRIKVELILRKLAEGAAEADLLDAYPRLTREDIHAAIAYAADTIAHEEIILLPTHPTNPKS